MAWYPWICWRICNRLEGANAINPHASRFWLFQVPRFACAIFILTYIIIEMVMVLIGCLIYLLYIYIFYYYSYCYHYLFNFHHQNRILTPTNEQIFHWVETINQYMFPYDHIITYAYITILHKLMSLVFESFVPIMWQFLLTQSRKSFRCSPKPCEEPSNAARWGDVGNLKMGIRTGQQPLYI